MKRLFAACLLAACLAPAVTAPRQAPEFIIAGAGPSGQTLLSSTRGKPVLLFLFFTTCPHCQRSAGLLNTLQQEYGPKGLLIIGAAFNENSQVLYRNFISRYQTAFPIGWAPRAAVADFLQHPPQSPFTVPIYVFIDRKGAIRGQYLGSDPFFKDQEKNTRAMIEEILKGSPVAVKKKK